MGAGRRQRHVLVRTRAQLQLRRSWLPLLLPPLPGRRRPCGHVPLYCLLAAMCAPQDRVHRLGQVRDVEVYRYVAADSIEERMMALQVIAYGYLFIRPQSVQCNAAALGPAYLPNCHYSLLIPQKCIHGRVLHV